MHDQAHTQPTEASATGGAKSTERGDDLRLSARWRRALPFADFGSELALLRRAFDSAEPGRYVAGPVLEYCVSKISHYERAAAWHLIASTSLRVITIVAGIASPIMLGVNLARGSSVTNWIAFAFAAVTALGLGFDQAFNFGERWLGNRKLAEDLKNEAWSYLWSLGDYVGLDPQAAAQRFKERFQELNSRHVDGYLRHLGRRTGLRNELRFDHRGALSWPGSDGRRGAHLARDPARTVS